MPEELTDTEVRSFAAKIAHRLCEGTTKQEIVDDVAELCGREWSRQFVDEVENEMRDYEGAPHGRRVLYDRALRRVRRALPAFAAGIFLLAVGLALDQMHILAGLPAAAVGTALLVVGGWEMLKAYWLQLRLRV